MIGIISRDVVCSLFCWLIVLFYDMCDYKLLLLILCFCFANTIDAQTELVRECKQKEFRRTVPAGNYSGITHLVDNKYAVVSDKSPVDGFYVFTIDVDSVTGELTDVRNEGFMGDSLRYGDCEGIAFCSSTSTLFISREADASIVEYDYGGKLTGRRFNIPGIYKDGMGNYGFESLTYDEQAGLFWTVSESTLKCDGNQATSLNGVSNKLRLQSFGIDLQPKAQYAYLMDSPTAHSKSSEYAMGVSELLALGNGHLLVLEREFFVPNSKIGAFVRCNLYEVVPKDEYAITEDEVLSDSTMFLPKRLVCSFVTKFKLFDRSIANYEGMCLGPTLVDGSKTVILVSDSQNQYARVLKDWFKTIVIRY